MIEKCENCRFYWDEESGAEDMTGKKSNFCRRYPATVFQFPVFNKITRSQQLGVASHLCPTLPDGWCGEYRVKK